MAEPTHEAAAAGVDRSRIEVGTVPDFPGEKGEGADGQLALL